LGKSYEDLTAGKYIATSIQRSPGTFNNYFKSYKYNRKNNLSSLH
jgi:hypothetical protein